MNKVIPVLLLTLVFCFTAGAQTPAPAQSTTVPSKAGEKPKRQIFRANKDQITQVQTMLKSKSMFGGEATGKLDDATRTAIKTFQNGNGLKETGTLNRATLEKMGIELTDKQKLMPVSPKSYASADSTEKSAASVKNPASVTPKSDSSSSADAKPKKVIFRATKDQIMEAQKILKTKSMYSGVETGKLDDATREGLKKFQEANDVKVTGTLNQVTLEKMGIELTDKQKADSAESTK